MQILIVQLGASVACEFEMSQRDLILQFNFHLQSPLSIISII